MLPESTRHGDEITVSDVREDTLSVAFPTNRETGKLDPVHLLIEITAPDFRIEEPRKELLVFPGRDTGKLLFSLVPISSRRRSSVHVTVKYQLPNGTSVNLGGAALHTAIAGPGVRLAAQWAWSMISLPLLAVSINSPVNNIESRPEANQKVSKAERADIDRQAVIRKTSAASSTRRLLSQMHWRLLAIGIVVGGVLGIVMYGDSDTGALTGAAGSGNGTGSGSAPTAEWVVFLLLLLGIGLILGFLYFRNRRNQSD